MQEDAAFAKEYGADGIVLGLLTAAGDVDVERTATLIAQARPMSVTFHRAIDVARNPLQALRQVMETGADRVLTSGAHMTALEGTALLRESIATAQRLIKVMVGGGVRAENVGQIAKETGATEWHASLRPHVDACRGGGTHAANVADHFGGTSAPAAVSSEEVRRLRRAIFAACIGPPADDAGRDASPPDSLR